MTPIWHEMCYNSQEHGTDGMVKDSRMGMVGRSDIESPEERRKAARAVTFRASCFTELTGEPRRCQGKVVDVSPSGFQVKSRAHVPIGSMIELEIAPRDDLSDGETLVACAKVVWTNPLSSGEVAMGLQNIPSEVLDSMGVKSYFLDNVPRHSGNGSEDTVAMPPQDLDYVQFREAARKRLKRRRAIWPYLLALLMLLAMLWFLLNGPSVVSTISPEGSAPFVNGPDAAMPAPSHSDGMGGPAAEINDATLQHWIGRGHDLIAIGHTREAIELFSVLLDSGLAEGATAGVALAGLVAALQEAGRTGDAAAVLARGRPSVHEDLPEAWQRVLDSMQRRPGAGVGNVLAPAVSLAMVAEDASQTVSSIGAEGKSIPAKSHGATDSSASLEAEVWLDVSLSEHVLRVRRGEELLAAFPIGTGGFSRTPRGQFRIVNRIVNPAWYNKGRTVPPGDSENPLGSRWMGLGDASGAIPYGIHGTTDPRSVGGSGSAGCLRMFPADVERLFEWCAVGDRVEIS